MVEEAIKVLEVVDTAVGTEVLLQLLVKAKGVDPAVEEEDTTVTLTITTQLPHIATVSDHFRIAVVAQFLSPI